MNNKLKKETIENTRCHNIHKPHLVYIYMYINFVFLNDFCFIQGARFQYARIEYSIIRYAWRQAETGITTPYLFHGTIQIFLN